VSSFSGFSLPRRFLEIVGASSAARLPSGKNLAGRLTLKNERRIKAERDGGVYSVDV
jgi:hypothetical protein